MLASRTLVIALVLLIALSFTQARPQSDEGGDDTEVTTAAGDEASPDDSPAATPDPDSGTTGEADSEGTTGEEGKKQGPSRHEMNEMEKERAAELIMMRFMLAMMKK